MTAPSGGATPGFARGRRLRSTPAMRRLTAQTRLHPADFVLPVFVKQGIDAPAPISSMPGVVQHTLDSLRKAAHEAAEAGIGGLILFGIPAEKDPVGSQADAADGYWGLLYEERRRGILERYDEKKSIKLVKEGDWNEFVITAKGDHVTIDLNGTRIIDRTDPMFDKKGIIALQVHAGTTNEVRFKDIAIKTLD